MSELPNVVKNQISQAYKAVKNSLPNFKDRFQQRKMIGVVSSTLYGANKKSIAIIEGPTGTGKTMAYLLGSIPVALHLEKKLVISSATIALQEQLLNKDIPLIKRLTDYTFEVRLAKGRGRYVCLIKLEQMSVSTQVDLLSTETVGVWADPPDESDLEAVKTLQMSLYDKSWDGDLDQSPVFVSNKLWPKINNNFHSCQGSNCPEYNKCTFYIERKRMGSADIIIANHDLVLADIASGDGKILPPIEDSLYIFDEAHHLPEKAINHFAASASLLGAVDWIKSIPKAFIKELKNSHLDKTRDEIVEISENLIIGLQEMHQTLVKNLVVENAEQHRFPFGIPDPYIIEIAENLIHPPLKSLFTKLSLAIEMTKKAIEKNESQNQDMTSLGFLFGRVENLYKLWQLMLKTDSKSQPPYARWLSFDKKDYVFHVMPISSSKHLQETLWSKTEGCILTSATLTALNSFDRISELSGLSDENTSYTRLSSPFDLSRVTLNVPDMKYTPKQTEMHTQEIIKYIPELFSTCLGSLMLFSSYKQMEEVYNGLPISLKKLIQVQGKASRDAILQVHRENIKSNKQSILFGLNSFSEGLDLPGELCEHVIIAKLPFAVPTSPKEEAYSEWVEASGKNPFFSISVPDASMKLIQSCGRLMRQEQDKGYITILDSRIKSTSYGKVILDSLPPFNKNV